MNAFNLKITINTNNRATPIQIETIGIFFTSFF
jgi:hypothetical protein